MTGARTVRARESERLLAADLRAHGAPHAEAVAASVGGRDILGIPGVAIEVKARKGLDILAAMRQAERNAGGDLPLVVVRMNGQGPARLDEWITFTRWGNMRDDLLREAGLITND